MPLEEITLLDVYNAVECVEEGQFFAAEDSALSYICIQVKKNSLEGYTMDDGVVEN